ncbi:MAG: GDSL-type esterase/lipase family protein [Actinomycetota bacterium]
MSPSVRVDGGFLRRPAHSTAAKGKNGTCQSTPLVASSTSPRNTSRAFIFDLLIGFALITGLLIPISTNLGDTRPASALAPTAAAPPSGEEDDGSSVDPATNAAPSDFTLRIVTALKLALADQASPPTAERLPLDPTRPQPLTNPVAILYGDSLSWESRPHFIAALSGRPGLAVYERTFGGTAICDWRDQMNSDLAALRPGVVVVQFSGNAFGSCMHNNNGPARGDALIAKYAADANAVVSTFQGTGTQVVFASSPIDRDGSPRIGRINNVYRSLAADRPQVDYVDAAASVLNNGRFATMLPCLPAEPCGASGHNMVRSPDGLHFCPMLYEVELGVTTPCPVRSSGAFRFGNALAQPVLDRL